jgi:hypothetical protein
MITHELTIELEKAGLKPRGDGQLSADATHCGDIYYHYSLSELIEACGKDFDSLHRWSGEPNVNFQAFSESDWGGTPAGLEGAGKTPEEAVARLWLAINKK